MLNITLILVIVCIISVILTGLIRKFVLSKNILDVPNDRSSHRIPTPRGGGLSIVLLFVAATSYLMWKQMISLSLFYALSGGILVAFIGWLDDIVSVPPIWRALVHTLSAIWSVYWLSEFVNMSWLACLLITVGIVWCTNLYNFMDGIDGLAGSEGLFISLSAAIVLLSLGLQNISILCFVLAGSILGFLKWNWPPAKIFMGDVASGYLGFIFSILAIATMNLLTLKFWIILASIFLCDATFTLLYRIYQKKRWYEAHCEHAYQRLTQYGASHKAVTIGILIFNIFILFPVGLGAIYYPNISILIGFLVVISFFIIWKIIISKLFIMNLINWGKPKSQAVP